VTKVRGGAPSLLQSGSLAGGCRKKHALVNGL
jgi:hypothetical protein